MQLIEASSADMPRKDKIRYFTDREGARGELPRYFWQPSGKLIAQGWKIQRIPDSWEEYTDGDALYAAAAGAAIALNRELDQTRNNTALTAARPPEPTPRTTGNLIKAYKAHDDYKTLAPKTRLEYDKSLVRIQDWAGDEPVKAIDEDAIKILRDGMAHTPSQCNATIRVLRLLLAFGMREKVPGGSTKWLIINAASNPRLTPAEVSGRIWPREAVQLFVDAADAMEEFGMGTAIVMDEWLGQREDDILRMPRTIYRDGRLIFRQAKGTSIRKNTQGAGIVLAVDKVPVLRDRLKQEFARQDALHAELAKKNESHVIPLNIVQTKNGERFKADWFRHLFAKVRAKVESDLLTAKGWHKDEDRDWTHDALRKRFHNLPAKERLARMEAERRDAASFDIDYLLPGRDMEDPRAFRLYVGELQFMHLRHTAITRLAEAECTEKQIAGVSGHSFKTVEQILERYLFRTAALSETAFDKRLAKEAEGV